MASQGTDSGPSGNNINVFGQPVSQTVPASDKCVICDQVTIDKSKCITCSMCKRQVHFICAESGSLNEQVLKIMKSKQNIHYICKKCSPSSIKSRLVPEDKAELFDGTENKLLKSHIKKMETESLNSSKNIDRLQQRNTQLTTELTQINEHYTKVIDLNKEISGQNKVITYH